jgi:hypothetical protein
VSDHNGQPLRDQPIAELLNRLSAQTTMLVHQELELAKAELRAKGMHAGLGAGMFGGASALGFYTTGALTASVILALATVLDAWLAALIVAVVYALIAGVLVLLGRRQVQQATPPVPEAAVDSTKEDVAWIKNQIKAARR